MTYEAVIGLEIHAELETRSKMFCSCAVVDVLQAEPNSAVCPVCAGMPGVLPIINRRAVAFALRVALALECEIAHTSIFERKNYFYPDLPKGYQISQYQQPLAVNGRLRIRTNQGGRYIRIRRVHIEEDTGKSTHISANGEENAEAYSLVDLNRAGIPLLEIVTEPDLHTPEEVRAYARGLRAILQYLRVNSGDMQKGVLRIEPNVSVRKKGAIEMGTRTEVKNLNSFRALERSVAFEIDRQIELLEQGRRVVQETVGWDETQQVTVSQRSKEEAHDYRYFPEPDLPPLVVDETWIESERVALPELPDAKFDRFIHDYRLSEYHTDVLIVDQSVADFFELTLKSKPGLDPQLLANWISGELFGLLNQAGTSIDNCKVTPVSLGALLEMVTNAEINNSTAQKVLQEVFQTGKQPQEIVDSQGLQQITNRGQIANLVAEVLMENPDQVGIYLGGKDTIQQWFFGQVMRKARGQANPQVVQSVLNEQLKQLSADKN